MHGVNPITYVDLDAWARLTRRRPTSFEVDALMRLDRVSRGAEPDDTESAGG